MKRLSLMIVVLWPAIGWADEASDCRAGKDPDMRINACSALIQSSPKEATAYHARGLAHQAKGDLASAIADYTKAIELNADLGMAYESRGRAYAEKGDYTNAVADVNKAGDLKPKVEQRGKTVTSSVQKAKAPDPVKEKKALPRAKAEEEPKLPKDAWSDWAPGRYGG
jgi:tetratricopeptide (TPR) repeat protein